MRKSALVTRQRLSNEWFIKHWKCESKYNCLRKQTSVQLISTQYYARWQWLNICILAWLPFLLSSPNYLPPSLDRSEEFKGGLDSSRKPHLVEVHVVNCLHLDNNKFEYLKFWFFVALTRASPVLGGTRKYSEHLLIMISHCPRTASALTGTSPTRCCSGSPEMWSPQFSLNFLSKLKNDLTWRQIPRPHFFLFLVGSSHLQ